MRASWPARTLTGCSGICPDYSLACPKMQKKDRGSSKEKQLKNASLAVF